jgi:hypothetical protein
VYDLATYDGHNYGDVLDLLRAHLVRMPGIVQFMRGEEGEGAKLLVAEEMYASEEYKPARWESLHLGIVLSDILPEVADRADEQRIDFGTVLLFTAAGFFAFFALERVTKLHSAREHEHPRLADTSGARNVPSLSCRAPALHSPGLSAEACRTESFWVGCAGQAEQGGGDDSREDDAARAREEGGVVAGVEDG